MLTAGHAVLAPFAQQGDLIVADATGDVIGQLFTWTMIDGDPTADAALIWVDPSLVSVGLRGLGVPREFNLSPAKGTTVRIVPHGSQSTPREAVIAAVDQDISVLVDGPGWPSAPTVTYRRQLVTDRLISEGGDSGAVALDDQDRVIGMVVAGSVDVGTVITPIAAIVGNAAWGGRQLELVGSIAPNAVPPPSASTALSTQQAAQPVVVPMLSSHPTPAEFINAISPSAIACMRAAQVPASFTIAQGALESAWGSSQLASLAFNLFGVKADASWTGEVVTMNTREFIGCKWISVAALWRKYEDWQACFDDHAAFLRRNPRYAACFATTSGEAFARAVAAAGYATDPTYGDKLVQTIRAHHLAALDAS